MASELTHILDLVTQGSPLALLDRVVDVHPGERIRGVKCITRSECRGQSAVMMPGGYPVAFIIEGMLQLAAVLIYMTDSFDPESDRLQMVGAEKVKVRGTLSAGDRVEYDLRINQHRSNIWRFHCMGAVDGNEIIQLELLVAVVAQQDG